MKMTITRLMVFVIIGLISGQNMVFGQSQTFSIKNFKNLAYERIKSTGARDTITERLKNGQSCVEASRDRAIEISYVVQSMQARDQFGSYGAKVGSLSGWNPGPGSCHTYTVVEIYDPNGNIAYTLDMDNYMGVIYISDHSPVNWKSNNVQLVQDIKPLTTLRPDLSGTWYAGGSPPAIKGGKCSITQNGGDLTFYNEHGMTSKGRFINSKTLEAWEGLTGKINADRNRINWSNNTFWWR
ncbi:hypothetical protein K8T06_06790 [bacterium]|nr:hypothetical protein [bacterium]